MKCLAYFYHNIFAPFSLPPKLTWYITLQFDNLKLKDAVSVSARARGKNFMTIDHFKLQYTTHRMPVFTNQVDVWCFMAIGYRREQGGKSSIISTKN